jgi:hypothetical protein
MSQTQGKLSRRTLFAGAGTAGAVVAVASLVPAAKSLEAAEPHARAVPAKGGGYHLSEHVKRYFKTTQI